MNIKQEVFSKITELSKEQEVHRIELANINQFTAQVKKTKDALDNLNKVYSDLEKLAPIIIKGGDDYLNSLDQAMDMSNDIFAKFKELGLDWTATPEYKEFKNIMIRGDRGTVQTIIARVKNL